MSSVYKVNKGIGQPVVFKGLKAQWIWWLCGGVVALLLLFAVMYIAGVVLSICVFVVLGLGSVLFVFVHRCSKKYGEHGLMKEIARRSVPLALKGSSRKSVERELCDEDSERSVANLVGRE